MLDCVIVETKDVEPVVYDWGAVKWVTNQDLAPGAEQSFGVVHILPGQTNPEHWHTAAEEIVYMLQGVCDVRVGDTKMQIVPGQTLYIPPGTKHEVANHGWEPVVYVCSFSASMRGTLFEDPHGPGAKPVSGKAGSAAW